MRMGCVYRVGRMNYIAGHGRRDPLMRRIDQKYNNSSYLKGVFGKSSYVKAWEGWEE